VEIRAKLESGDLEKLGQVGRPLGTPSKTFDLFYQFESSVKMSEVCSKYEQLGQLTNAEVGCFACFAGIRNQRRLLKTIRCCIYDAVVSRITVTFITRSWGWCRMEAQL